ncbi:ketopantoate reductase family protein [archaeon]|nr:MAG: ketopantoate reductase family protein [archaeon]
MQHVVVFGSGAVGLSYGLQLLETELRIASSFLNLSFIARRDCELIRNHGVRLVHDDDKEVLTFTADNFTNKVFGHSSDVLICKGKADWLIVCSKTTSLDSIRDEILALAHSNTKILLIMNGLGMEDAVAQYFPHSNIYGAVAYIGANRGPNPPLDSGPLQVEIFKLLNLEIGHYLDDQTLLQESVELWKGTRIAPKVLHVTNLLRARWCKLCWNLTFSGIAVAMGGLTTDVIIEDEGLTKLADDIITESIHVANADIHSRYMLLQRQENEVEEPTPLFPSLKEDRFSADVLIDLEVHRQRLWLAARTVGKYKASTVLDLIEGKELEMHYMYSEVLRRARLASVSRPSISFAKLEAVLIMVEAMGRISSKKKVLGLDTHPTLFTP